MNMIQAPAIRGNAGRFVKGQSGNPGGRPKRTDEELQLIEACREKTPEALAVIFGLMRGAENERVRLAAAESVLARGWGRPPSSVRQPQAQIASPSSANANIALF